MAIGSLCGVRKFFSDVRRLPKLGATGLLTCLVFLCSLFLAASHAFADGPAEASQPTATPVSSGAATIAGSQTWTFKSEINGVDYKLFVFVPHNYDKSRARYPVFYLLDGNEAWPSGYAVVERLIGAGEIPPLILATIGYKEGNDRWLDYPTAADSYWKVPKDRGAPVFLDVIKKEIVPFVERTYRADPSNRGLGGHSMGGYFTLFTLISSPETFQKYWISSPSIAWDSEVIFRLEETLGKRRSNMNARVYADTGELEAANFSAELRRIESMLNQHHYSGLKWTTDVEYGLTHGSVPVVVLGRAIENLYGRDITQLAAQRLKELEGEYRLPDGTTFRLVKEGSDIYLSGWKSTAIELRPAVDKLRLLADSPNSLYAPYINLNFVVPALDQGAPSKLLVSQPPVDEERNSNRPKESQEFVAQRVH